MNEAATRLDYIDPALKAAGWGIVAGSRMRPEYIITLGRIEGNGRRGKALTADYVLEYRNTKLADGKERTIQHMIATSLWHMDGTPMSAAQFMPQEISRIFVDFQQYLYQQAVA